MIGVRFQMKSMWRVALFTMAFAVWANAEAAAGIIATGGPQKFATITAEENFQSFDDFYSPSNPFSTGGLTFKGLTFQNALIIWPEGNTSVGFPTRSLYQNGGINSMLQISLSNGDDLQQLQFDVGNGAGRNPEFIWLRAYNNGAPSGFDFDFTIPESSTLAIWTDDTTQLDEIRIGAYLTASDRDAHDETGYSVVSIDNVIAGTRGVPTTDIPEPFTITLFGVSLAGLLSASHRRKKVVRGEV